MKKNIFYWKIKTSSVNTKTIQKYVEVVKLSMTNELLIKQCTIRNIHHVKKIKKNTLNEYA